MPKEYIPKDAANKWICETCDGCEGTFCVPCDGNPLKDIPAADVVEVVRCQDCVYWRGENDICKGTCIDFGTDGYCSEGKRRDRGLKNGMDINI